MHGEHRHNRAGDLVLDREDGVKLAVVALGPAMGPGDRIYELGADPDMIAGPANAALQDVAHPEFVPNLPHVDGLALVLEARVASDHQQLGEPR